MTPDERRLLEDLFAKLRQGSGNQPRDPEAEAFIAAEVRRWPPLPYALAQTALIEQLTLQQAEARIRELERQLEAARAGTPSPPRGSFLGDLASRGPWGRRTETPAHAPGYAPTGRPGTPGYGMPAGPGSGYGHGSSYPPPYHGHGMAPGGAGSFLRGAAQTAAGIVGGMLAFQAIDSMISGGDGLAGAAQAGELASDAGAEIAAAGDAIGNSYFDIPPADEALPEDAGYEPGADDFGGDFGDEQV